MFKADDETGKRYSISEWWLEPNTQGPGAHSHDEEDCIFYVIEGTMSILLGDRWIDAPKGSGILNFSIPGGFEKDMPAIAQWFAENPPKDARP